MCAFYHPAQITELVDELVVVRSENADLVQRFMAHAYKTETAAEFAKHGFNRRILTLKRALENVYELLPPDLDVIPEGGIVEDAAIAIHAFVANTFGALDNLAWILVFEKNVVERDGTALDKKRVSLANKNVRKACSQNFQKYMNGMKNWDREMREYRDSLVHRIPLYIPPFTINPKNEIEYAKLERAIAEARRTRNNDEYDKLVLKQRALGRFQPFMVHAVNGSNAINFHPQLITDLKTVHDIGKKVLAELSHE